MSELLIITSAAPYSSSSPDDALDAALAASNVGLQVSVLFEETGVLQLIQGTQKDETVNQSLEKRINSLEMFDIESLYYCKESLIRLGLQAHQINMAVSELENMRTKIEFIKQHKHILRF